MYTTRDDIVRTLLSQKAPFLQVDRMLDSTIKARDSVHLSKCNAICMLLSSNANHSSQLQIPFVLMSEQASNATWLVFSEYPWSHSSLILPNYMPFIRFQWISAQLPLFSFHCSSKSA